jgi:hypothetical protein
VKEGSPLALVAEARFAKLGFIPAPTVNRSIARCGVGLTPVPTETDIVTVFDAPSDFAANHRAPNFGFTPGS